MERIIGREIFKGKISNAHEVHIHELGYGHKEVSIIRAVEWEHVATMSDAAYAMYLEQVELCKDDPDAVLANKERAARRAKTKVRRLCKAMGLDALLTLTYRANQQDLALCKRHMKEFVRRVRRLIPGFAYVAAFEQQERGAWHVHMAVHALPMALQQCGVKVKSYSVIRAVWRGVVGELDGNIDQARRKRNSRRSPGRMASYISKYILKAFHDGEDYTNRYSASSCSMPKPVRMRIVAETMADLITHVYSSMAPSGTLTSPWLSSWGDRFFLSVEPGPA